MVVVLLAEVRRQWLSPGASRRRPVDRVDLELLSKSPDGAAAFRKRELWDLRCGGGSEEGCLTGAPSSEIRPRLALRVVQGPPLEWPRSAHFTASAETYSGYM